MKERPIIFSGPMVRAILDGSKTQTRRIINPQPVKWCQGLSLPKYSATPLSQFIEGAPIFACPHGRIGDRLWVRESWSCIFHGGFSGDGITSQTFAIMYRAGGDEMIIERDYYDEKLTRLYDTQRGDWRPSIHMPRWASRINLEISGVCVERLNDISEEDAKAEGCDNSKSEASIQAGWYEKPVRAYERLWEQINGAGSWQQNPWVWVIKFKRVNTEVV